MHPQLFPIAIFNDVGGMELIIVAGVALLLFGKDMPLMTRKLGKIVSEFKRTLNDASSELKKEMDTAASELEKAGIEAEKALPDLNAEINGALTDSNALPAPSTPAPVIAPPKEIPPDASLAHKTEDPLALDRAESSTVTAAKSVSSLPPSTETKHESAAAPGLTIKVPTDLPPSV